MNMHNDFHLHVSAITQPVGKAQGIPLNAVQLIQQPPGSGRHLTYQLQQIVQNTGKNPGSMIITSQPTIIATMTQSQQQGGHMVTKVLGTAAPTPQIQTIASTTPLTVAHVTAVATPATQTQATVATISVAQPSGQVNKPVTISTVTQESGTTIQVHPVVTASQQAASSVVP